MVSGRGGLDLAAAAALADDQVAVAVVVDVGRFENVGRLVVQAGDFLRRAFADADTDALLGGAVDGHHRPQARLDVVGMVARERAGADAGAGQQGREQEHFQGSDSRISSRRIMPERPRRAVGRTPGVC